MPLTKFDFWKNFKFHDFFLIIPPILFVCFTMFTKRTCSQLYFKMDAKHSKSLVYIKDIYSNPSIKKTTIYGSQFVSFKGTVNVILNNPTMRGISDSQSYIWSSMNYISMFSSLNLLIFICGFSSKVTCANLVTETMEKSKESNIASGKTTLFLQ